MVTELSHARVLQVGQLPLRPDGSLDGSLEHACTATLVWPMGEAPTPARALIVDPGFTARGWRQAKEELAGLGLEPAGLSLVHVTHPHLDHAPRIPGGDLPPRWRLWDPERVPLPGVSLELCPGHDPELFSVRVQEESGETWIVGDAVLDRDWLLSWGYYWPNGYTPTEVVETWRSVARILRRAHVVIPGHGAPFPVTGSLLDELLGGFERAPHSDACPDVAAALRARLEEI